MSVQNNTLSIAEKFFPIGLKAGEKLIECLPIFNAQSEDEFAHRGAMMSFFAKAYKSYQAIHSLWMQGFSEDALTLSRSLFELMLQALWVHRRPIPGARRFLEHERVAQYLNYERLKKMGNVQDFVAGIENRKDELDRLKADFDRLKPSYKKGKKGKSFNEHWWNGTISDLAQWLGPDLQKQYHILYPMMSGYVHSDAHSFAAYLNWDSHGWLVNCRPSKPAGLALLAPLFATGWFLDIVRTVDLAFDTGLDAFLKGLHDEWQALADS